MNDLIIVDQINPVQLFDGKSLDPLLERITKQVKEFELDVSTAKGRKEIAALAHKVAKSKTFLDSAGKELVSEWKLKAKVVDAERKKMRDYLDNLKNETRKPLTEWEEEEAKRQQVISDKIYAIKNAVTVENEDLTKRSAAEMQEEFEILKSTVIDESFGDRANEAAIEKERMIEYFGKVISARIKYEEEQAELERLRLEAEARKKADEEERLRKEGEERARREAENAAKVERDRIEKERLAEIEAAKKREADKKHKAKINNAAMDALVNIGLTIPDAKNAVIAIASGKVPHVKISY